MLYEYGMRAQVLVWKTNFDRVNTREKLHSKTTSQRPHTHDYSQDPTHHLDAMRLPKDNVTPPLNVVDVGPRLFHRSVPPNSSPGRPTLHSNISPEPLTAPLEPISMPPQLANTLEHIVRQLDVLTQVRTYTHTYRVPSSASAL